MKENLKIVAFATKMNDIPAKCRTGTDLQGQCKLLGTCAGSQGPDSECPGRHSAARTREGGGTAGTAGIADEGRLAGAPQALVLAEQRAERAGGRVLCGWRYW